jgi:membrane-associated protease RseP (regulator of RpoE activity)
METTTSARSSLVTLVVGTLALAALLTWMGGWALPVVILAILVMIMGHEFGHFITAKRAGMKVTDFFVGFGPVVWSITRGDTRYGVRAFPIGGYVKVPGMTWTDTIEPDQEGRTYRAASYPRKALFASAGSLMHVVMAFALAWASLTFVGLPSASHVGIAGFTKWDAHALNAAQIAGLRVGDRIVAIDGHAITDASRLVALVHDSSGKPLTLLVSRHGHELTLHATPVDGRTIKVAGAPLVTGSSAQGYLGIQLEAQVVHSSFLGAVPTAVHQIGSMTWIAVHAMVHVFSPGQFSSLFHQVTSPTYAAKPSVQLQRPLSIVGVGRVAVQAAQSNIGTLLELLMTVNIFVGLLNMLPMLPLDGGYVAVATYERLRSRRGRRYHADANKLAPVAYGFMSVLLVLFACTLYLDIASPIANPFR